MAANRPLAPVPRYPDNLPVIHALPGMGADRRMFPPTWSGLPDLVAHDWLRHSGETSLAEVARSSSEAWGIRDGDTLVGCSLGGMVACEIARIREIRALYLVGSATRKEEVSGLLAALHPLVRIAPIDWIVASAGKIPAELTQMFSRSDPAFLRAMAAAVFQWEGMGAVPTRIFRIHGKRDRVIPPPKEADLFLDGGHLISMTHATECVEFVRVRSCP